MLETGQTRLVWCAAATLLLSACATDVYKDDIASFKKSTDEAVAAFESLRSQTKRKMSEDLEQGLAAHGARVQTVSVDCTAIVTDRLQKDSKCLAEWASYRATSSANKDERPSCIEPARDSATGALQFYDLSKIANTEARLCRLGRFDGNQVHPDQLVAAGVLETTAQLGEELKQYAGSLGQLANAKDVQELKSAAGDAVTAIGGLVGHVEKATGEKVPGHEAIGPVGELLGSALTATLEARRYAALRSIVDRADPVVRNAAAILSRNSMPLMIPRLRAAGNAFTDKVNAFNNELKGPDWIAAMTAARNAQAKYLELYNAHPSEAFRAMANAHAALRKALDDPTRQFEALKSAISEFSAKAKAAYQALVPHKPGS